MIMMMFVLMMMMLVMMMMSIIVSIMIDDDINIGADDARFLVEHTQWLSLHVRANKITAWIKNDLNRNGPEVWNIVGESAAGMHPPASWRGEIACDPTGASGITHTVPSLAAREPKRAFASASAHQRAISPLNEYTYPFWTLRQPYDHKQQQYHQHQQQQHLQQHQHSIYMSIDLITATTISRYKTNYILFVGFQYIGIAIHVSLHIATCAVWFAVQLHTIYVLAVV